MKDKIRWLEHKEIILVTKFQQRGQGAITINRIIPLNYHKVGHLARLGPRQTNGGIPKSEAIQWHNSQMRINSHQDGSFSRNHPTQRNTRSRNSNIQYLSRISTIHRTAGELGGYLFNYSLRLLPTLQTLRHYQRNYCKELTSTHS